MINSTGEFKPDSVNVNVSEEGVVTYGKATSYDTYNYEGKRYLYL